MKRRSLVAASLVFVFVLALATPAFAMTHTASYEWDGTVEMEKQVGHFCNTGAEMKQTIDGDGKMEKLMDVSMSKGILTVEDDNDFVTADDATNNLTVTSVITLCAPPKAEWTPADNVYDEFLETEVVTNEVTQSQWMDAVFHPDPESYLQTKYGDFVTNSPAWATWGDFWEAVENAIDGEGYYTGWDNQFDSEDGYKPWDDCKEFEETFCTGEIPWATVDYELLGQVSYAWELLKHHGGTSYDETVTTRRAGTQTWTHDTEVLSAYDWFELGIDSDLGLEEKLIDAAAAAGDRQVVADLLAGRYTNEQMSVLANRYLGEYYHTHTVNELTDQIWAVQVEANPGFSGNLVQEFEAAYGDTFEGVVDEKEDLSDDGWGFEVDGSVHAGFSVLRGEEYVGNYFNIDQHARTSDGVLKRFIDISSPFSGAYLMEDFEVEGEVDVEEAFTMTNIAPGVETEVIWYDLF